MDSGLPVYPLIWPIWPNWDNGTTGGQLSSADWSTEFAAMQAQTQGAPRAPGR